MAKINVLDSSVYNYIAAGEVVERPASVIKELVENSIDAGATIIEVEVEGGGINKIVVSDNGFGIEKEYIRTAFMPHATSKIAKVSDLDSILTLGFRGEALASIAAVSKVTMTSKTKDQDIGNTIRIEAGKVIKEHEIGAKDGTTTIVSDLFYCVPARQKFLKKPKTEEQEITNLISRFILSHPEIAFTYRAEGKTIFSSSGKTKDDALFSIYGKEALSETLKIDLTKGNINVCGYVGRPSFSKPNRTYQTLIINGRYVINQTVATAVANAFGDMLMKRKYPFYVLYLNIPSDSVDVNVHPNKLDVRFENSGRIYSLIFEAVSRALSRMDYVASAEDKELNLLSQNAQTEHLKNTLNNIDAFNDINIIIPKEPTKKIDKAGVNLNPFSFNANNLSEEEKVEHTATIMNTIYSNATQDQVKDGFGLGSKLLERLSRSNEQSNFESAGYSKNEVVTPEVKQDSFDIKPSIKKIGKIFNTYLLIEVDKDVFFIDQHAAHERILYEKFKAQYDNGNIVVQPLLFPYVLTLNPIESNILLENIEQIQSLGFDIDEFGNNTFKISAVPAIVSEMNFDSFFSEFLSESRNIAKKSSELIRDSLMQHSCKSAIKGGNDLSESEIDMLYSQMGKEKIALFCPHGRPIAIRINKNEIEKWFKRIV